MIKSRVKKILNELNQGLIDREEAIRLSLLVSLCEESIFLLGPPGVAKSLISRRLKNIFKGESKSFEYLMNRFSTPDEIFGPISIKALKDNDELKRKTEHYLPNAKVVFLDEIWKAGPSIQNALLTVINEKIFRNAGIDEKVKMKVLISASNELPAIGEGLGALWDRFLVRLEVTNIDIEHRQKFKDLISLSDSEFKLRSSLKLDEELLTKISRESQKVTLPDHILDVIYNIRERIEKYNDEVKEEGDDDNDFSFLYVSDRRWRKIIKLIKTSAYVNGRNSVDRSDCFLIIYCIWNNYSQIEIAHELVCKAVLNDGAKLFAEAEVFDSKLERIMDELKPNAPKIKIIPQLIKDFYRLDLSEHGDYLIDTDGTYYRLLKKSDYDKLNKQFSTVPIFDEGKKKQVEIEVKKGNSLTEIIIRNKGNTEIKKFNPTGFHLVPINNSDVKDETPGLMIELESLIDDIKRTVESFDIKKEAAISDNLFIDLPETFISSIRVEMSKSKALLKKTLDRAEQITRDYGH